MTNQEKCSFNTVDKTIATSAREIAESIEASIDLLNELFQQIADLAYEILLRPLHSDDNIKPKTEPWKKSGWKQQHDQRYKILFVFGRRKRKKRRPDSDGAFLVVRVSICPGRSGGENNLHKI